MQLGQLRNALGDLTGEGAEILAVDPHESWSARSLLRQSGATTNDVHFPLLMDPSLTVSATYGVAFQMRVHVERSNRPATFVIDKQGVIRFVQRAETFSDRPSVGTVVDVLKGLNEKSREN